MSLFRKLNNAHGTLDYNIGHAIRVIMAHMLSEFRLKFLFFFYGQNGNQALLKSSEVAAQYWCDRCGYGAE